MCGRVVAPLLILTILLAGCGGKSSDPGDPAAADGAAGQDTDATAGAGDPSEDGLAPGGDAVGDDTLPEEVLDVPPTGGGGGSTPTTPDPWLVLIADRTAVPQETEVAFSIQVGHATAAAEWTLHRPDGTRVTVKETSARMTLPDIGTHTFRATMETPAGLLDDTIDVTVSDRTCLDIPNGHADPEDAGGLAEDVRCFGHDHDEEEMRFYIQIFDREDTRLALGTVDYRIAYTPSWGSQKETRITLSYDTGKDDHAVKVEHKRTLWDTDSAAGVTVERVADTFVLTMPLRQVHEADQAPAYGDRLETVTMSSLEGLSVKDQVWSSSMGREIVFDRLPEPEAPEEPADGDDGGKPPPASPYK